MAKFKVDVEGVELISARIRKIHGYIGNANKKYDFAQKLSAMSNVSRERVQGEINNGFIHTPAGCHIILERKAQEYILDNIRANISTKGWWSNIFDSYLLEKGVMVAEKYSANDSIYSTSKSQYKYNIGLKGFMEYSRMDVRSLYNRDNSFTMLCKDAGIFDSINMNARGYFIYLLFKLLRLSNLEMLELGKLDSIESRINKGLLRLGYIDSVKWIDFLLGIFEGRVDTDKQVKAT